MSAPVVLSDGGEGEALRMEGELLLLVLPRAFAPGAPMRLSVTLEGAQIALEAKTVGSKRREDERFDVRVRLINVRKDHRERLRALPP